MTLHIPYGEAWILETLAMIPLQVWLLTRREQAMREWLNRGFHKLSPPEFQRTLRRLFDDGDIEAFRDDDDCGFNPTDSELVAAFRKLDKKMYCGVTRRGGQRWESLANPNWDRYFEYRGCGAESAQITAGSHERLIELVNGAELLWQLSMDAATLDVECLRQWEALTWKSLPVGFRAIVPYTEFPVEPKSREDLEAEHKKTWPRRVELLTWATSICGHAYV